MSDTHARHDYRDVPGALNGSRLIRLPHIRPEVVTFRSFIAGAEPVLLEVGFDHGRRLQSTAQHNPGWRVVGLEVRRRRVEQAQARAARHGLGNLLAWRIDARTAFAGAVPADSIQIVEVLFPDPWLDPAKRRKRQLIDGPFLADAVRALRPGGLLHLATDVVRYAEEIERCLADQSNLTRLTLTEGSARRPPCEQLSRREWKCRREATPVHRFFAQRAE